MTIFNCLEENIISRYSIELCGVPYILSYLEKLEGVLRVKEGQH